MNKENIFEKSNQLYMVGREVVKNKSWFFKKNLTHRNLSKLEVGSETKK